MVLAIWIDFTGAFGKVPINHPINNLMKDIKNNENNPQRRHDYGKLAAWLANRRFRTRFGDTVSSTRGPEHRDGLDTGVPQGIVTWPQMWRIFVSPLLRELEKRRPRTDVQTMCFADDMSIRIGIANPTTPNTRWPRCSTSST